MRVLAILAAIGGLTLGAIGTAQADPARTDLPSARKSPHAVAPVARKSPHATLPVAHKSPHSDLPVARKSPHVDLPVAAKSPHADIPVATKSPHADIPVATKSPHADIPVARKSPHAVAQTEKVAAKHPAKGTGKTAPRQPTTGKTGHNGKHTGGSTHTTPTGKTNPPKGTSH